MASAFKMHAYADISSRFSYRAAVLRMRLAAVVIDQQNDKQPSARLSTTIPNMFRPCPLRQHWHIEPDNLMSSRLQ
jgi:hypothetical protein